MLSMYIIQQIRDLFMSIGDRWMHWNYKRKCLKYFGAEPETIYVSEADYNALIERLNEPPDPETTRKLKSLLERKAPWDDA